MGGILTKTMEVENYVVKPVWKCVEDQSPLVRAVGGGWWVFGDG